MYKVGDKIVYPTHGAGIITGIEEKKILGETKNFYVLVSDKAGIKIMLPCDNADKIGVRPIITRDEALALIEDFKTLEIEGCENWNKRFRANSNKVKSGNTTEVMEVVKSLMIRDRDKILSNCERKMLFSTKQILFSEWALALEMDFEDVDLKIQAVVEECE